jgi:hypothetical protein
MRTILALLALSMLPPASAMAQGLPDGAYTTITVTAIGGGTPITLPVRQDVRGDDEVMIPYRGWIRCRYRDCEYTVRNEHFHYRDGDRTGQGIGRGILLDIIGIE